MAERPPTWRMSTFCVDGQCVEAAALGDDHVGLRNGGTPEAGPVIVSRAGMGDFLRGVAAGEFDDLA